MGIGKLSSFEAKPQVINELQGSIVKKIVCGDNYTAVISGNEKLLVCGNMEKGKLGLGSAFYTGVKLSLEEVELRHPVKDVACGPFHMVITCKTNEKKAVNKLFACGANKKGQLGVGTTKDSFKPK